MTVKSTSVSINVLVLHVFLHFAVYSPSYLLDIGILRLRTYSHMCPVSVLSVGLWSVVVE
jgi:hypothetical protein